MLNIVGNFEITKNVIYISDTVKLLLRERKNGITDKKPRNFLSLNGWSRYFSSLYPVVQVDNWQTMTLAELNQAGVIDFIAEYKGIEYIFKIDASKNYVSVRFKNEQDFKSAS